MSSPFFASPYSIIPDSFPLGIAATCSQLTPQPEENVFSLFLLHSGPPSARIVNTDISCHREWSLSSSFPPSPWVGFFRVSGHSLIFFRCLRNGDPPPNHPPAVPIELYLQSLPGFTSLTPLQTLCRLFHPLISPFIFSGGFPPERCKREQICIASSRSCKPFRIFPLYLLFCNPFSSIQEIAMTRTRGESSITPFQGLQVDSFVVVFPPPSS